MSNKKYLLSINGDVFEAFKSDFDSMLRQILLQMDEYGNDEATINMKMTVSLVQDLERDLEAPEEGAMRSITKPSFKHDISTVMQLKSKRSGSTSGTMKMVWDAEQSGYVLQDIEDGQTSLFDQDETGNDYVEPAPVEEAPEPEKKTNDSTAYDYLRQYIGQELKICNGAGFFTVRTKENKVVLSSAFKIGDPFFCPAEILKDHEGHNITCIEYAAKNGGKNGSVHIGCSDCGKSLFSIDPPDRYDYGDPT